MTTITISKKTLTDADLVLVPRQEYENLLRVQKISAKDIAVKRSPSFRIAKKQEKFYSRLDKELTESLKDYQTGNYYGPFKTIADGKAFLSDWSKSDRKK